MTQRDQSVSMTWRTKTTPSGRRVKVYMADCPRCHQEVDLKMTRNNDGELIWVFKAHRDRLAGAPCPMAETTPEAALGWINETRAQLGLAS